jgi:hypothetical protein
VGQTLPSANSFSWSRLGNAIFPSRERERPVVAIFPG